MTSKWFPLSAIVGAAVTMLMPSAASAQIPSSGVFHACVRLDNDGGTGKLVRLVAANEACKKNESRVTWNAAGAQGPQGPQGEPGVQGPQGAQGETGARGPSVFEGVEEAELEITATAGNPATGPHLGVFENDCATHLVGFRGFVFGTANGMSLALSPLCAGQLLPPSGSDAARRKVPEAQGWIGQTFMVPSQLQEARCPAGSVPVGIAGYLVSRPFFEPWVLSIKLTCASLSEPGVTTETGSIQPEFAEFLPEWPTRSAFSIACTGGRMITGVRGKVQATAFGELRPVALGLACQ